MAVEARQTLVLRTPEHLSFSLVLAGPAVAALAESGPSAGTPAEFRRLLAPDEADRRAAALLRHPDLVAPVAALHHAQLVARLDPGQALVA